MVLNPTGGAIGFPDTAWHNGQWRALNALDSLWTSIPAVAGSGDSTQIQIQDPLGRLLYGTWEARTADGSWNGSDSFSLADSSGILTFRTPPVPVQIRLHLFTPDPIRQCPLDSTGTPVCTPISVSNAQVLWDYVLPGEDTDL